MKPLSVGQIRTILSGELIQGSDHVMIHWGAYRLKQVKRKNTILFSNKNIVDWERLKKFSPLVLVTDQSITRSDLKDLTVIKVTNMDDAYWKFVKFYRELFKIPVVAITGTSGKTTTKEMIKHILLKDRFITATKSTNNSRTAHLHYLLSIDDHTEAAVFETAVGAPGDILKAGKYFKPTIGIITNIGAHHLNYCKSIDGYIQAKGEMLKILGNDSILIINSEDTNTKKINFKNFGGKIIKIGKNDSCDYKAYDIKYKTDGMEFSILHKQQNYHLFVPGLGEHQVFNALASIAAVHAMGISLKDAAQRLKTFQKFNKQLQVIKGLNNATIIDDTWSMTTTSLEAALNVLNEMGKKRKKIAILGTITDLGSWGYIIHKQAGDIICQQGVDVLITIGKHAKIMADRAKKCSSISDIYSFNNSQTVYDLLKKITDENSVILIKGDMYSNTIIDLAKEIRKNH